MILAVHAVYDDREVSYPPFRHRRLVNTVQAAAIANVTVRTIYNWRRQGWIECVRTPSGGVRIYEDTLLRHTE